MKKIILALLFIASLQGVLAQGSGHALLFSGTDDGTRVEIPHHTGFWPNGFLSIEAWIKPNAYPRLLGMIFSKHRTHWSREYDLMIIADGRVRCTIYGADNTPYYLYSNRRIDLNHWTHLAFTYSKSSGQMHLYINGEPEVNRLVGAVTMQTTTQKPLIGAYWHETITGLTRDHFSGVIDEVRVWGVARSLEQIRDFMCRKLPDPSPNLIAYYKLDESAGAGTTDASGNGHHGALIKNPVRQLSAAPIGDTSVHAYDNPSYALPLESPGRTHTFGIAPASGGLTGAHLYRVDTHPNSQTGLSNPLEAAYFGVFLTNKNSRFQLKAYTPNCYNCLSVFSRNDNRTSHWQKLSGVQNQCELHFSSESSISEGFRGEYSASSAGANMPAFTLGSDTTLCPGQQLVLNPDADGDFYWQDGSSNREYTVTTAGVYWLRVSNSCGAHTDSLRVAYATEALALDLGQDRYLCNGEEFRLDAAIPGATFYRWQDGHTEADYLVKAPGTYTVTAGNSCQEISRSITFHANSESLQIPNVITPNDDQKNDWFWIGENSMDYSLMIYNRWGKQVFASAAYENNWDGSGLKTGSYYYILTNSCSAQKYKGWVTILR